MGMSWPEIRSFLSIIRDLLPVEPITVEVHNAGIDLAERYRLSVFDAMIVSAALLAQCDARFSEDLQNGLLVDRRLRIVNPSNHKTFLLCVVNNSARSNKRCWFPLQVLRCHSGWGSLQSPVSIASGGQWRLNAMGIASAITGVRPAVNIAVMIVGENGHLKD